jgi:hypothetical protein
MTSMNKAAIIEEIKWPAEVEGGKPGRSLQLSDQREITMSIDNPTTSSVWEGLGM